MPKVQCQHCHHQLEHFDRVCPECHQPLLATSATRFIGEGLLEFLRYTVKTNPEKTRKKTALYLKFCRKFLCDSELALFSLKNFHGRFDERSYEAIKDVIGSHRQHAANLDAASQLMAGEPILAPVVKLYNLTNRRMDKLLREWLVSDFGGRTFK